MNTTHKYDTCTLYIQTAAPADSKTFMKVTKSSKSTEGTNNVVKNSKCIQSSTQKLCLDERDYGPYSTFEYTRPDGEVSKLRFSMQWYNPSNGTWLN